MISVSGHCAQIREPLFNFSASWSLAELVVDPRGIAPNIEFLSGSLSHLRSSPDNSLHCLVDSCILLDVLSKRFDSNYVVCHYQVQNVYWY